MATKDISPAKWENVKSLVLASGSREDGKISKLLMAIDEQLKAYSAGQIQYDPLSKLHFADTGISGVRVSIGTENYIPFFNDTGVDIEEGKPINATGVDATNNIFKGIIADNTSPATSSSVIGISTHLVPDQTFGFATELGKVNNLNTDNFTEGGILYLGVGGFTQTKPLYPNIRLVMGSVVKSHETDGIIYSRQSLNNRRTGSKSYSFTSQGILAGTYYIGGFYDFPSSDVTLTQSNTIQLYGDPGVSICAHASAIFGGVGTVDAGQVGLRVNGTSITDEGVLTEDDSQVISDNITTLSLNKYLETPKKWVGEIEFELYIVSGSPTIYSLSFNYGFSKYEDIGNQDFTITDFEVVGLAAANDSNFDVEVLHHKFDGWTYAASGFEPGDGVIVGMIETLTSSYNGLSNGRNFAFKRTGINQFIDGNGPEGIIIRVTAGQNNSVQSMNAHLAAVSEEL